MATCLKIFIVVLLVVESLSDVSNEKGRVEDDRHSLRRMLGII